MWWPYLRNTKNTCNLSRNNLINFAIRAFVVLPVVLLRLFFFHFGGMGVMCILIL